uniref:Secreted protein n=1 Tax=Gongylonema pulchrum TaxID=637853 RepID=A0A183EFF0_9BILA
LQRRPRRGIDDDDDDMEEAFRIPKGVEVQQDSVILILLTIEMAAVAQNTRDLSALAVLVGGLRQISCVRAWRMKGT